MGEEAAAQGQGSDLSDASDTKPGVSTTAPEAFYMSTGFGGSVSAVA